MTYANIADWVEANYNLSEFASPKDLIEKVKLDFFMDGMHYPEQASSYITDRYTQVYSERDNTAYQQLIQKEQDKKMVEEMMGGALMRSGTDDIVEDLQSKEAMGIDFSTLPHKEEPIRPSGFSRLKSFFGKLFRR